VGARELSRDVCPASIGISAQFMCVKQTNSFTFYNTCCDFEGLYGFLTASTWSRKSSPVYTGNSVKGNRCSSGMSKAIINLASSNFVSSHIYDAIPSYPILSSHLIVSSHPIIPSHLISWHRLISSHAAHFISPFYLRPPPTNPPIFPTALIKLPPSVGLLSAAFSFLYRASYSLSVSSSSPYGL
jgi:hypothetical protein